jgi:hypothetical protein
MLAKYVMTGWSNRFGYWVTEIAEAKDISTAKERFCLKYPMLKNVKALRLRAPAELME